MFLGEVLIGQYSSVYVGAFFYGFAHSIFIGFSVLLILSIVRR